MPLGRYHLYLTCIEGGLNLSSSKRQAQPPDNRTVQNFVKDYMDEYVGGYTVPFRLINHLTSL